MRPACWFAAVWRVLPRRFQVLLDRWPAHVQVAFDFADRAVLGPIHPVQIVDLLAGQHRQLPLSGRNGWRASRLLFARFSARPFARRKCFNNPDLRRSGDLVCKKAGFGAQKPNACSRTLLSPKLRCCFARFRRCLAWSRTCCRSRLQSSLSGFLLSVLPPVIGMRIAPLTRAVSSNLPVFGGVCQFLFAVFLFALPLTCGGAANQLRGLKLRCLETLPAIPTTPFVHIARCLTNTRI